MLLKRIIPCLDVDKGRVVKGIKYVDHVDAGDPVGEPLPVRRQDTRPAGLFPLPVVLRRDRRRDVGRLRK